MNERLRRPRARPAPQAQPRPGPMPTPPQSSRSVSLQGRGRPSAPALGEAAAPTTDPTELDSIDRNAIALLAHEYFTAGATDVARVLYAGLAALEPTEPQHRLGWGLALDRLGHTRAAREQYGAAAKLAPHDAVPLVNLAELALEAGELHRADRLLRRALELDEKTPGIHRKADALRRYLRARNRS